ncbi:hypothetical protein BCR34DRAFT_615529 [Clohesyomyces aquaticus]|uniref:Macro domain-containing protein n=1 Tax=Clohesyomyces aquaticus TaxID=1231657 RepID=A0A1Y1ZI41_9PLEO|nr:hypothetical protein BCR34DRAFT_615529 [Clohesyomyces aquaticus]
MATIRLATAANIRLFQTLSTCLTTADTSLTRLIDPEALEDEFGRFRVWAGNLGALQKGHSSLDYRLRDSPLLSSNTLKFLEELSDNLTEAIAVVSGKRLPYEQQAKPEESEEEDDFFSEDEDDDSEEGGAPKTELDQRFREIVDIIQNLYRLSVRIRSPTIRSRSLKAASYRPKDPETGVDILEEYAVFDLQHTQELIRFLRVPHAEDVKVQGDFIIERLSKAVTLRRRQFKYWRRHRDKLGVSTIPEDLEDNQLATAERPGFQRYDTLEVQPSNPNIAAIKASASEKAPKSLLSGTEVTQHHQSLDDIVDSQSVTSYATTTHDLRGNGIELPSPPKAADGEKDFECPYCFIICPARYGRGRPWRTHLLQDLQPYICTYEDCGNHDQLIRSRREWIEHEASHRKAWRCPEHPTSVYKSQSGLENHLRLSHADSFPEHQLASIIKISETSTIDLRPKCPICLADADMEGGLQNHIANHLERIASFALPKDVDVVDDDDDGASSVASRGRSITTGPSQDLSSVSSFHGSAIEQDDQITASNIDPTSRGNPLASSSQAEPSTVGNSLSAELLGRIPDSTGKRMDILSAEQGYKMSLDDDFSEGDDDPAEDEEPLDEMESFRTYLLAMDGAQNTRFLRRYGNWRGYVHFTDEASALGALQKFDNAQFPKVKLRQGSKDKASLRFMEVVRTRTGTDPHIEKDSVSSKAVSYTGEKSSGLTILPASEVPTLRSLYKIRKLQQRDQSYAPNVQYNGMIGFTYYDITRIKADAIVNSANRSMKVRKANDTLNYSIHKAGGPGLKRECEELGGVKKPGQVRVTSGHDLPSSYVIHVARPEHFNTSKGMGRFNILTECYRSSLKAAKNHGIKTIVFPCIGSGGCGFPARVAARIALQEVREFLDTNTQRHHQFDRIIFCVYSTQDEKAYKSFLPVYFPPTHRDVEDIEVDEVDDSKDYDSIVSLLREAYVQAEGVTGGLVIFSDNVTAFPRTVMSELAAITSSLRSLEYLFMSPPEEIQNLSSRTVRDIYLICSVMMTASGSMAEIVEQTKYTKNFGEPTHKTIWDEYNFHMRNSQGLELNTLLEICQDFVQCLEDILIRGGTEPHEMSTMRVRLSTYRLKQTGEGDKAQREVFDEVMYTRDFHRDSSSQNRTGVVKLHQIPSLGRLYQLGELEYEPTKAIPDGSINHTVGLIREDISRLEVDVIVNSTDIGFSGMGTLDRVILKKGGVELQEDCATFGKCKEGDIRHTPGYKLPAKYIIHTIPPDTYRKNTKDALRKIYREVLNLAESLKATSLAIPSIGTGMLNYPRRDAASIAMEEVKRYLETMGPSGPLERIIFCVFGSTDELIYKSLLPVFFPPVDLNVNKAIPTGSGSFRRLEPSVEVTPSTSVTVFGQPSTPGGGRRGSVSNTANSPFGKYVDEKSPLSKLKDTSQDVDASPPPKRSLFGSIGSAFRNVRFGKQPVSHTMRPLQSGEEHALLSYEAHARDCPTCSDIARLYADNKDLCADGYGEAQLVLQYLYMDSERSIYSTTSENKRKVMVEFPQDYKHAWNLLYTVERSFRDGHRTRPFVSTSQPYPGTLPGVKIYEAEVQVQVPVSREPEKAVASVFSWSEDAQRWEALHPLECSIHIYPGKVEMYETDHLVHTNGAPLLSFELSPLLPLEQKGSTEITFLARTFLESRMKSGNLIMLKSRSPSESEILLQRLIHSRNNNPMYLEHRFVRGTAKGEATGEAAGEGAGERGGSRTAPLDLPSPPSHDPSTRTQGTRNSNDLSWINPPPQPQRHRPDISSTEAPSIPKSDLGNQAPGTERPILPINPSVSALTQQMQAVQLEEAQRAVEHQDKFDLSIAGLSYVDLDEYYSYLDNPSAEEHSSTGHQEQPSSNAAITPQSSEPPVSLDSGAKEVLGAIGYLTDIPQEPSEPTPSTQQDMAADDPRQISYPRPTTPETGEQSIPPEARWTKIDKWYVSPEALREAGLAFEERGMFVVVSKVLTKEEIENLTRRTKELWRDRQPRETIVPPRRIEDELGETGVSRLRLTKWTRIDRRLISAQALEEVNERFEQRDEHLVVMRMLTRAEIMQFAERTREIRRGRQELKEFAKNVG